MADKDARAFIRDYAALCNRRGFAIAASHHDGKTFTMPVPIDPAEAERIGDFLQKQWTVQQRVQKAREEAEAEVFGTADPVKAATA
ncbi:MAG TPA: hypothetical protein VNA25_00425 [Phycisphaerae bacterium]|nr:hypothetical protein [Phycisphaerae bacterium]